MKYRPEIDGLRTVAVVPVILFHAGYSAFQGGYVGVDVFFVISGFLITGILHDDLAAGRYSLLTFYERRARRILPALFFVLAATLVAGWTILMPEALEELGRAVAATALFASNIYFYFNTNYFSAAGELNPMLHTWSLAVEEQFYIVTPVLLAALWRWFRPGLELTIGLLTVLSLAAAVLMHGRDPSANFFLIPFRAWELGIGAMLALRMKSGSIALPPRPSDALAILGLFMIALAIALFDKKTAVPGLPALLPTIGTALVLAFANREGWAGRILAWRPMVFIGLLSYSAYLWHQPLFALYRHWRVLTPGPLEYLPLILATFALAAFSWRFVEMPFRDRSFLSRGAILTGSVIGLTAIGGAGLILRASDGAPGRHPAYAVAQAAVEDWRDTADCSFDGVADRAAIEACVDPGRTVYLFGDSHAQSFARELRDVLRARDIELVTWTAPACMPIPGTHLPNRRQKACHSLKEQAFDIARNNPAPVILSSRWRINLDGTRYDNAEGGVELGPDEAIRVMDDPEADVAIHSADKIAALAADVPVILVDQIPEAGWDAYALSLRHQIRDPNGPAPTTSLARYREATAQVRDMLAALPSDVTIVETAPLVCDEAAGRCENARDGVPLYRDDDHPSRPFARMIAEEIADALASD